MLAEAGAGQRGRALRAQGASGAGVPRRSVRLLLAIQEAGDRDFEKDIDRGLIELPGGEIRERRRRSIVLGRVGRTKRSPGEHGARRGATVDGNRWADLFRALPPPGRLVTVGALAIPASMLFPWYGIQFGAGLSETGFDSFGLGQLALLLTVGAALYLILRYGSGSSCRTPCTRAACLPSPEPGRRCSSAT